MRPLLRYHRKIELLSTRTYKVTAALTIGSCFALGTILGILGAQHNAAPNFPLPEDIVVGLILGTAIWASLIGISLHNRDLNKNHLLINLRILQWIFITLFVCTVIPILYFFQRDGEKIFVLWKQFIRSVLFSALSFGLGGVIIGIAAILIHIFFIRMLMGLKWGLMLTCIIGLFLGLCTGWAAYGWMVLSSHALFNMGLPFQILLSDL